MQKSEDAVIPMQQNSIDFSQLNIQWLVGSASTMDAMLVAPALKPFSPQVVDFLAEGSKALLSNPAAKAYTDVITFGFWVRKASISQLEQRFVTADEDSGTLRLGRGIAFHVAPSNVPVNYAYSLVSGLLMGNANVVRIPSKSFPQVDIINAAIAAALQAHTAMAPYIALVRYGHDKEVSDAFSAIADVRIIWGGDGTIAEFRKSPIGPRATEVCFADRYSLAVIDAKAYLAQDDVAKERTASDFYNDTYLTYQNACTSPRLVAWIEAEDVDANDKCLAAAKEEFWSRLHALVEQKYELQGVQAVNKLTSAYLLAAAVPGSTKAATADNLIIRVQVPPSALSDSLMELKDNSGYFFEADCASVMDLFQLCNNTHCQTISYIGDANAFEQLIASGIKGVDRIVPIGKTMDFDLIWDGYNLYERLTRQVSLK